MFTRRFKFLRSNTDTVKSVLAHISELEEELFQHDRADLSEVSKNLEELETLMMDELKARIRLDRDPIVCAEALAGCFWSRKSQVHCNDTWNGELPKDEQRILVQFDEFVRGKQQEVTKAVLLCSLKYLARPYQRDPAWSSIFGQFGAIQGPGECALDKFWRRRETHDHEEVMMAWEWHVS
jgi:hypothetical protein